MHFLFFIVWLAGHLPLVLLFYVDKRPFPVYLCDTTIEYGSIPTVIKLDHLISSPKIIIIIT